jgi:class 3 adenylate cyclase
MLELVTVLFADVVGSTARAERMHPEDTRALMADYFAAMSAEIQAEGGTTEKFVGDGIMAVFGVPAGLLALPFFADRLEGPRLALLGEPQAGAKMLLRFAEGFRQLGAAWEEAWSRLLAAEVLLAVDADRAHDAAAAALPTFERLGSVQELERARKVL